MYAVESSCSDSVKMLNVAEHELSYLNTFDE